MLEKLIVRTPLIASENGIYLKPENLQTLGSYKIRGIVSVIRGSDPGRLRQGISAASAGNMGQAVAYLARELNLPCKIFVPETAPDIKKSAIRALGAEVVELPYTEVWSMVRQGARAGLPGVFIHPFFTEALLEGYGAIARELYDDLPGLDAVVIPFGVGGLTTGITRELRRLNPGIAIYACEPETATPLARSLESGRPRAVERTPSFVDATGTPEVLPEVFSELIRLHVKSRVVSLQETRDAMAFLYQRHHLICEGSAATSLAAGRALLGSHRRIACILTGGNISPEVLAREMTTYGKSPVNPGLHKRPAAASQMSKG
jgi:threonine dehydratase